MEKSIAAYFFGGTMRRKDYSFLKILKDHVIYAVIPSWLDYINHWKAFAKNSA